jgi:hypothetical protein
MEEKMVRLLTYTELTRCTKAQLWDLYYQVLDELRDLAEGSADHETALMNIRHIRMFLARRDRAPGPW